MKTLLLFQSFLDQVDNLTMTGKDSIIFLLVFTLVVVSAVQLSKWRKLK